MMALILSAPIGVRARTVRVSLLLLPLAVAAGLGCSSKRSSLRPVYVAPAPVVAVPAANCPGGAGCPTDGTAATVTGPASTSAVPSEVDSTGQPFDIPSKVSPPASPSPSLTRPGTGPTADPDEYPLRPIDPKGSAVPPTGSAPTPTSKTGSNAPPPSARLDGEGRRVAMSSTASSTSTTRALRTRLSPYVEDRDDLFNPPKADRPWKYVVLHHSATKTGGYDAIDAEHRKRLGWAGCGYHFVIGNGTDTADGAIEVSQRWRDQKLGVHCRDGKNPDVNEYGIGICLVGDFENAPPTTRQIAAAKALVSYLEARYQIPADRSETHSHLAASPTSCPGRLFPSEAILGNSGLANR